MAIILTRHAEARAVRRYPGLDRAGIIALAEMSLQMGMKYPGRNGCLKCKFFGKEFVFDQEGGEIKLVTVI